jgi:hypothetical protein
MLDKAESLVKQKYFINSHHATNIFIEVEKILNEVAIMKENNTYPSEIGNRIERISRENDRAKENITCLFDVLDGRSLRHFERKELVNILATSLLQEHGKHGSAEALVFKMVQPFIKNST